MVINGNIETGTMVTKIPDLTPLKAGELVVLEQGYYNAGHILNTIPLSDQTAATATSEDVADGFIGWSNGVKIVGNFTSRGAAGEITPAIYIQKDETEDKFNIAFPKGFYSGENPKIEVSLSDLIAAIGLTSDKIADGSTILNINGDFTRGAILDPTQLEEHKIAYKDGERITGTLQAQSVTNIQITKPSYRSIRVTWANPAIGPYQGVRVYLKSGDTVVRSFIGSGAAITPNATNYITFDYIPDGDYTITVESYAGELISPVYFTQNVSIDIASTRLLPGTSFQAKIPTNITSITRRYGVLSTAEINSAIDLSNTQNKSVLLLRIGSGTTYNIWSESYNIYLNANSYRMFRDRTTLRTIDTTGWITTDVTNMSEMFYNCQALTLLDLNNFNTIKVQQMRYMFYNCKNLRTVYYSSNFRPTGITNLKTHASSNNTWYMFNASPAPKPVNYWTSSGIQAKWLDNGTYTTLVDVYMTTGGNFNARINKNMMYFVRSTTMPTSGYSDISRDGDGSIRTWYNSSNRTQYWWTLTNENVFLHASSDHMFNECRYLTSLNMSSWNWNTTNVTTMYAMFNYNTALTSINFGSVWSTSNVTDMRYMFRGCNAITSIGISGWNTAKVTRMDYMFSETTNLKTLNISSFNTAKVTIMNYMFNNSGLLNITYGSGFVNTSLNMTSCAKYSDFTEDSIPNLQTLYNTIPSYKMFFGCKANKPPLWRNGVFILNEKHLDTYYESGTGNVYVYTEMVGSFIAVTNGKRVYIKNLNGLISVSKGSTDDEWNRIVYHTNPDQYIENWINTDSSYKAYNIVDISVAGDRSILFAELTEDEGTNTDNNVIITSGEVIEFPVNMNNFFSPWIGMKADYFEFFMDDNILLDTSRTTSMHRCFAEIDDEEGHNNGFNELCKLFDVSNVTDMSYMFYNCRSGYKYNSLLDLNHWNTNKLVNMNGMFYNFGYVGNDMSNSYLRLNFDTSNVLYMNSVFRGCTYRYITIESWNTSKVTDMRYFMFDAEYDLNDTTPTIYFGDNFINTGMDQTALKYNNQSNPTFNFGQGDPLSRTPPITYYINGEATIFGENWTGGTWAESHISGYGLTYIKP